MLSLLRKALNSPAHRPCPAVVAHSRRQFRPSLEALESRLVPASIPFVWTGASTLSDHWSDSANWLGGKAPTAGGADVIFGYDMTTAGHRYSSFNDLTDVLFNSITFRGTGPAGNNVFSVSGTEIDIGSGGITSTVTASGKMVATLNVPIALTQPNTTITVNTGTLAMGGPIISAVNGVGLVKQGAGSLLLNGPGNNYVGQTRVAAGQLLLGGPQGVVQVPSDLQVGDGAGLAGSAGVQAVNGQQIRSGVNVTVASDGALSLAGETFSAFSSSGSVTLQGTLTVGGNNANCDISGPITGSGNLNKIGTGGLTLTGNDTCTGLTVIAQGSLQMEGGWNQMPGGLWIGTGQGAPGSVTVTPILSSNLAPGKSLSFTSAGPLTVNSDGLLLASSFARSLSFGSLAGSGEIRLLGGDTSFTVGTDNTSTTFSGQVIGNRAKVTKAGTGTLTLSGGSIDSGLTTQVAAGTLKLAPGNGAAVTGRLVAGTGTGKAGSAIVIDGSGQLHQCQLTLNRDGKVVIPAGVSDTIASLSGTGIVDLQANDSSSAQLTAGSSSSEFDGSFTGHGILWKVGTGTLTLGGASPGFTGIIDVTGGTLAVKNGRALGNEGMGPVVGDGAILQIGGGIAVRGGTAVLLAGATLQSVGGNNTWVNGIEMSGSATVDVGTGRTLTVAGLIDADGKLTKTGKGTLLLRGQNVYWGGTVVAGGTLIAGSKSALGTGTTTVKLGATLQLQRGLRYDPTALVLIGGHLLFTGTAASAWTGDLTLAGSSALNNPSGTLATGAVTLTNSAFYRVRITGPAAGTNYGQLAATGPVGLNNAILQISLGYRPAAGTRFVILKSTGPIQGKFSQVPRGLTVSYENNEVVLTVS